MKNFAVFLLTLALPFMSFNPPTGSTEIPPVKKKVTKVVRRSGDDNIVVVNQTPYTVNVDIKISLGPISPVDYHYTVAVPGNQTYSTPNFSSTCSYIDGNNTTYMLVEWTSTGPAAATSYQFYFSNGTTYGCKRRTTRNGGLGTYLDQGCGSQFLFLYESTTCGQ